MGIYLADVGPEQGPLGVIPGSHEAELFDHYNEKDQWVGSILEKDMGRVATDKAVYLEGSAGSMTIHNCRTVHGSKPNLSTELRPLLLYVFSAADAMTYTVNPIPSPHEGTIVRGKKARWAHHDPRPCVIPPDWSAGYTSIFAMQQEESWEAGQMDVVARQRAEASGGAE
jgi:ectoine hydroxylase-related dioxygenase (phytanoyl-CoA dioxygenase family)